MANTTLAVAAAARRDSAGAARAHAALAELPPYWAACCHTCHAMGLASVTLGETDRAITELEAAREFYSAGYRPHAARCALDLGGVLLARGAPGDARRAESLFEEALATATQLGMRPLGALAATTLAELLAASNRDAWRVHELATVALGEAEHCRMPATVERARALLGRTILGAPISRLA